MAYSHGKSDSACIEVMVSPGALDESPIGSDRLGFGFQGLDRLDPEDDGPREVVVAGAREFPSNRSLWVEAPESLALGIYGKPETHTPSKDLNVEGVED